MSLGTLGASLLGNLLTGNAAIATSQGCLDEVQLQHVKEQLDLARTFKAA